jgi:hypothetical protein
MGIASCAMAFCTAVVSCSVVIRTSCALGNRSSTVGGSACFYDVDNASNAGSTASAVFNSQEREQCILLQDESREGEGVA